MPQPAFIMTKKRPREEGRRERAERMGTERKEPERERKQTEEYGYARDTENNEGGTQKHTGYKETERHKLDWGKDSEGACAWKRVDVERERYRQIKKT